MYARALKNNKTLKITQDKVYEVYEYSDKNLVSVINDEGDDIVISSDHFIKLKKNLRIKFFRLLP